MRSRLLGLVAGCFLTTGLFAQTEPLRDYRNFPIVVTIQFHSLSLPFRNMGSNLSNIGFGLGTEVSLSGKQDWTQQLSALWYHNKAVGNGLMFYTQAAWRPTVVSDAFTEIKAGAGFQYSFRPSESFRLVDGHWVSAGHRGKGMLVLPLGVSVGHNGYSNGTYVSPFVSYQFLLANGYSKSIPIVPETLLQAGVRIHPE